MAEPVRQNGVGAGPKNRRIAVSFLEGDRERERKEGRTDEDMESTLRKIVVQSDT